MQAHECYHCKQWVEADEAHDCWTTTEAALTKDLSDDLREAWERLREAAAELGDQRIYASHNSIMFARKTCYFFVRPKRTALEVCVFLGRPVNTPPVRRVDQSSKTKFAHMLRVTHRDEIEAPITDWLREAYEFNAAPKPPAVKAVAAKRAAAKRARKPAKAAISVKKKPPPGPQRRARAASVDRRRDRG
jgi:hypothetical protein